MSEVYAEIARKAAVKLVETGGSQLPQFTERVLSKGEGQEYADQYDLATALGIASLLVSIASLTWSMYSELRKKSLKPDQSALVRRIQVQVGEPKGVSILQRDRIIEVVVEETLNY